MQIPDNVKLALKTFRHMDRSSHKGQNGKVLLVGGSELFHAASRWSLDVVSSMVDMVFYSSVPENNELIREAKREYWDGVVVPRGQIENYISEADVVLIGPGMERKEQVSHEVSEDKVESLSEAEWNHDTEKIVNFLLTKYASKKWVIDAGALQMVDPKLLNERSIITPHQEELSRVEAKFASGDALDQLLKTKVTILLKGRVDEVMANDRIEKISGGNPGMTKGGTGDALAGLIAGLYVFSDDPMAVAVVGSFVNKMAGDALYAKQGPFFKTSELVAQIPIVLKEVLGY